MPIRPENRHFYRDPEYLAAKKRVRARSGNRCERCGVRNHLKGYRDNAGRFHRLSRRQLMVWEKAGWPLTTRVIRIVLTCAHLDNNPAHNGDDNLADLCQRCHLVHDIAFHQARARETRRTRKDRNRPLLAQLEARHVG